MNILAGSWLQEGLGVQDTSSLADHGYHDQSPVGEASPAQLSTGSINLVTLALPLLDIQASLLENLAK